MFRTRPIKPVRSVTPMAPLESVIIGWKDQPLLDETERLLLVLFEKLELECYIGLVEIVD
jgi:hypothetical protein